MLWACRPVASSPPAARSSHGALFQIARARAQTRVPALRQERIVQLRAQARCRRPPRYRTRSNSRQTPRAINARSSLGYLAARFSPFRHRHLQMRAVTRVRRHAFDVVACVRPSRCCPCHGRMWRSYARSRLSRSDWKGARRWRSVRRLPRLVNRNFYKKKPRKLEKEKRHFA